MTMEAVLAYLHWSTGLLWCAFRRRLATLREHHLAYTSLILGSHRHGLTPWVMPFPHVDTALPSASFSFQAYALGRMPLLHDNSSCADDEQIIELIRAHRTYISIAFADCDQAKYEFIIPADEELSLRVVWPIVDDVTISIIASATPRPSHAHFIVSAVARRPPPTGKEVAVLSSSTSFGPWWQEATEHQQ